MGQHDITIRVGSWKVRPVKNALVLRSGDLEISVPFCGRVDRLRLQHIVNIIEFLDKLLQEGKLEGKSSKQVKLTLTRLGERRWLFSARGSIRYDVELTTEEALLMALAVKSASSIAWPLTSIGDELLIIGACVAHGVAAVIRTVEKLIRTPSIVWEHLVISVMKDRLEKAELLQDGVVAAVLRPGERGFTLTLTGAGRHGLLGLLNALSERLGCREMRVNMLRAASLLIGEKDVDELLDESEVVWRARELLIKELFGIKVLRKALYEVRIKNEYGRWTISLRDGDLELNGEHICIVQEEPGPYGVVHLPSFGRLELDRTTAKVLNAVAVALWPEKVRDPDIREQIQRACGKHSPRASRRRITVRPWEILRLLRQRRPGG